jgi:putative ABC transport system ATP-binding protein
METSTAGSTTGSDDVVSLTDVSRTVRLPDGKDLHILTGVNLHIARGEHIAVVGRSGSGKSTLLNIVGLLDAPTGGQYLLDGKPVSGLSGRRTAKLRGATFGFVFQQFNLLPGRTATENVANPLMYATGRDFLRRKKTARAMLERVGLGHRLDTMPEKLSGGEQQRVALARSLVRRPRVLLADEPTGALEELVRDDGTTLVTITHDLSVASRADRQFRLDHGVLTEITADTLASATAHRETM